MWRFWILVCLFVVVECRRIHDPEKDKVKNIKETDISSGDKKDHKIVEAFDLDNCTGKCNKINIKAVVLVRR